MVPSFLRRSVRTKLIAAFLGVAAVVVALGLINVGQMSSIHAQVEESSARDVKPLADLQGLTDDFQAYAVHGLVAGLSGITGQVQALQQQTALKADSKKATDADLAALAEHIPSNLRSTVDAIKAGWEGMVTKDAAYQAAAAAGTPDANAKNESATASYLKLEQDINALKDTLVADEVHSRGVIGDSFATARLVTLLLLLVGVLLALGLGILIARDIRRGISPVRAAVEALAQGDLTHTLDSRGEDEFGQLSNALDQGVGRIRGMVADVVGSAGAMTSLVGDLTRSTASVVDASRSGVQHAQTVSGTAATVSGNVAQLATGAEEMTASIRDISRSAQQAAAVADDAVRIVASTNDTLNQLGNSSAEIGNVIKVITGIAEQTNLLALNATIEAARAGELGKGFAVVATEVKELAQETAKATEDVALRIQAIQADSGQAVQAIARIGDTVGQINELQATIAAAVEEQTASAAEIDRNIGVAAQGSRDIASGAEAVAGASETSASRIDESRTIADQLAARAADLESRVAQFTV
ncbi:methyl-accepting chemotaxis protein [Modestobacter sp. NPDC049651]|uniref:methyl-accepting chemotaxis protein n=1 Tax=unclassified Modestobacter TaxID=2643866 RepID=UPI0033C3BC53